MKTSHNHSLTQSALIGTIVATIFAVWVLLALHVEGDRAISKLGTSPAAIIISLYTGGIAGGVLVGWLLPLTRTLLGKTLVGTVIGILCVGAVQTAREGPFWHWTSSLLTDTIIIGAVMGAGGTLWLMYRLKQ